MKESVMTDFGLFLALWRAHLKPTAFHEITVSEAGYALPWWGANLRLRIQKGDQLVLMPTPWGLMVDQVVTAGQESETIREAA